MLDIDVLSDYHLPHFVSYTGYMYTRCNAAFSYLGYIYANGRQIRNYCLISITRIQHAAEVQVEIPSSCNIVPGAPRVGI